MFASDADGSGPNAEVTYSIVSTHDKFSIDSKTGWLVTNAVSFFFKFIYSEKATKFCEIFPLLLTVCNVVKSKGKISQNFVAILTHRLSA